MLTSGQVTLGTVSTVLFQQPPAASVVTITSDTASTSTAYVGAGTVCTTTNSCPLIPGGSISWATYTGSGGGPVSAVTYVNSGAVIGWLISTADR